MAMGCPHQGRSGGLNATITSRPFDSPRPSPGGYTTNPPPTPSYGSKGCGSADLRKRWWRSPPPAS